MGHKCLISSLTMVVKIDFKNPLSNNLCRISTVWVPLNREPRFSERWIQANRHRKDCKNLSYDKKHLIKSDGRKCELERASLPFTAVFIRKGIESQLIGKLEFICVRRGGICSDVLRRKICSRFFFFFSPSYFRLLLEAFVWASPDLWHLLGEILVLWIVNVVFEQITRARYSWTGELYVPFSIRLVSFRSCKWFTFSFESDVCRSEVCKWRLCQE